MDKLRKILFCSMQNLLKWSANPRIYVLGLLLLVFLSESVRPIAEFSSAVNVPVTPWVFPYLALHQLVLLCIMLGVVLLFCDAPFIDAHQPYVIIRSGKKNWLWGQILYIMIAAALYFLFIVLCSILMLLPNLTYANEWGKVFSTLALTDAGNQFKVALPISYQLQHAYTPMSAMVWSFLMSWLVGVFLGLLMFVLNMRFKREIGAVVATALVFLQYFAFEASGFLTFSLSPVSWASLGNLDITHTSALPSLTYAVCALIGLNLILILLANLLNRKKSIDVLPPV
ncbi:hypothetical protein DesLBE_5324 [Desulfitobacterium sp. LBE]|uniref:Uncharacterized protein n=1 Tax=Desulfitobacterium hafniense (strain Y51) TaxID=138119 RepID=Q24VK5_DESHY|nr:MULTISPECIES: hypothetical protein [Desulfitobacterium]TWH60870.1 hypothetical protein DesLBE_5324 [Desulfitobacterium sp. LBE]BAE83937.1 hypothetical protein DSY2148 [Desulfitobacterium hafniense Y51]